MNRIYSDPSNDLSSRFSLLVQQKQRFLGRDAQEELFTKSTFIASSEGTGKSLLVIEAKVKQLKGSKY